MSHLFTTFRTTKSVLPGIGLVSILLLASGCSSTSGEDVSGASGSDGSGTTELVEEDAGKDGEAESTDHDALTAAKECFPGTWSLDVGSYQSLMDDAGNGLIKNASGVVTIAFAQDGAATTSYNSWATDVVVDYATDAYIRNGTDSGTYEISADGSAVISDTSIGSEEKVTKTRGDKSFSSTEIPEVSMFRGAPLTCDGDEITAAVLDSTLTLNRDR